MKTTTERTFSAAMNKAMTLDKYALGVLYQDKTRKSFEEQLHVYEEDPTPVIKRKRDLAQVEALYK